MTSGDYKSPNQVRRIANPPKQSPERATRIHRAISIPENATATMRGCHNVTALQSGNYLINLVAAPHQRLHRDGTIFAFHGLLDLSQIHADFGERVLINARGRANDHNVVAELERVAVHSDFGHTQLAVIVGDKTDIFLGLGSM